MEHMERKRIAKYEAALVGCGYGDTLGMAVEGWKKEQIEKHAGRVVRPIAPVLIRDEAGELLNGDEFGRLKYYTRDLAQGDVTDDTLLTMAIAESLVERRGIDLGDICRRQAEVYFARLQPNGHVVGGFGRTTKDAFERLRNGASPLESGISPGLGTGPCMKMAPIGLYMDATGRCELGLEAARLIGRATHLDERAIASGIVQANAVYFLLNFDLTQEGFIRQALDCCTKYEKPNPENFPEAGKGNLKSRIEWIYENMDAGCDEARQRLGNSSLAVEAYPFTLFMFQKYWHNPIDGLIETVNYGGDCDTTGAMYGALCGAKNGMIFPADWKLNEKERLIELGSRLGGMKNVQ